MSQGKTLELSGLVFGRLTAISRIDVNGGHIRWQCKCSCGKLRVVRGASLTCGDTTSCGCLQREVFKATATAYREKSANDPDFVQPAFKHGMSKTDIYNIYRGMITRCYDKSSKGFEYYGARGVTVCDRWLADFTNFVEDIGNRPSRLYSLERIDGEKSYAPENVKWATDFQQARNRRMLKNNTSGKTGVSYNRNSESWVATCSDPITGKILVKPFSIMILGNEEAYDLACIYRDHMIKELNSNGAGYSKYHGKG